jgi:hypothetical protein
VPDDPDEPTPRRRARDTADKALARARRAVERTPADDPRGSQRMKALGARWRQRVMASGDTAELDRAIEYFRAARGGAATALAVIDYNLAVLVSDRYDIAGDPADLAEATKAAQRALDALRAGATDRYDYLAMLSVCLWERYDAAGSLADLDRAIGLGTQATVAVPPGAPLWPRLNSNLGMMLIDRHERAGDAADLDRAVGYAAAAVRAVPAGDGEGPGFRNNLAGALRLRFESQFGRPGDPLPEGTIDLRDLDEAIRLLEEALAELAAGPAEVDQAMIMSNLGDVLMDRALMHELADAGEAAAAEAWSKALAMHEAAVAATSPSAPDRPGRLNKLAVVQRALADRTGAQADIDAARVSFRAACALGLAAAPEMALAAAVNWTAWEIQGQSWAQAVAADGYALRAAEALHRSQQQRADRETWLLASRGLAPDAAYAAARGGDVRGAVARLERGRAILLADELDLVPAALSRLPDAELVRRYAQAARLVRELQ